MPGLSVQGLTKERLARREIGELEKVLISSASPNEVLVYNGTNWVNQAGAPPGSHTLGSHSDVTISGPTDGDVLVFDSGTSMWIDSNVVASDQDPVFQIAKQSNVTTGTYDILILSGTVNSVTSELLFKMLTTGTDEWEINASGFLRLQTAQLNTGGDFTMDGGAGALLLLESLGPVPTDAYYNSPTITLRGRYDASDVETAVDVDLVLDLIDNAGNGYLKFTVDGADEMFLPVGGGLFIGTSYVAPPDSGLRTAGHIYPGGTVDCDVVSTGRLVIPVGVDQWAT